MHHFSCIKNEEAWKYEENMHGPNTGFKHAIEYEYLVILVVKHEQQIHGNRTVVEVLKDSDY